MAEQQTPFHESVQIILIERACSSSLAPLSSDSLSLLFSSSSLPPSDQLVSAFARLSASRHELSNQACSHLGHLAAKHGIEKAVFSHLQSLTTARLQCAAACWESGGFSLEAHESLVDFLAKDIGNAVANSAGSGGSQSPLFLAALGALSSACSTSSTASAKSILGKKFAPVLRALVRFGRTADVNDRSSAHAALASLGPIYAENFSAVGQQLANLMVRLLLIRRRNIECFFCKYKNK